MESDGHPGHEACIGNVVKPQSGQREPISRGLSEGQLNSPSENGFCVMGQQDTAFALGGKLGVSIGSWVRPAGGRHLESPDASTPLPRRSWRTEVAGCRPNVPGRLGGDIWPHLRALHPLGIGERGSREPVFVTEADR